MQLTKLFLLTLFALFGAVACGKLKLLAFKGHHGGFIGLKARKPKLLGHGFGGHGGHGKFGGFGAGGYHSSGYEHHESHHSYYSGGGGGFGGGFGGGGWLGK